MKRGIRSVFLNNIIISQTFRRVGKKSKTKIGNLFFFLLLSFIFFIWALQSFSIPTWTNPDAVINSSSGSNFSRDNITANGVGGSGSAGENTKYFYNWFWNNISFASLYFPFEGDSATVAKDYSNGTNGAVSGAFFNATGGFDGFGAYKFDGINDYINVSSVMAGNRVTYGGWIKFDSLNCPGEYCVIMQQANSADVGFEMYTDSSSVYCYDGSASSSSFSVSTNTWYHIMCRHDGTQMCLFVNGTQINCVGSTANAVGVNFSIGGGVLQNNYWFNGSIAEVVVYNRALSSQQIMALYNNETNKIVSQETRIREAWHAAVYLTNGSSINNNYYNTTWLHVAWSGLGHSQPTISSSSGLNFITDNITALGVGGDEGTKYFYNWFRNNISFASLYLPFEGDSSTRAKDYSNGTDGAVSGAFFNATGGHEGFGAYKFDGINDYINVSSVMAGNRVTYGGWIKFDRLPSPGNYCYPIEQADSDVGFLIYADSSDVYCYDGSASPSSFSVSTNTWYHIMCRHDGTQMCLFVNGTQIGNCALSTTNANGVNFSIGGNVPQNNYWFNGSIAEVVVYNRALSSQQIMALYNNETNKIVSQETSGGETLHAAVYITNGSAVNSTYYNTTGLYVIPVDLRHSQPIINSSLGLNFTSENITAWGQGAMPSITKYFYNWFKENISLTVLNMPFEGDNSTLAKDYSGHGEHGTVNGAAFNSTAGYDGFGTYSFDDDDSINLSKAALNFTNNQSFSFSLWIRPHILLINRTIFIKTDDSGNRLDGYGLYWNNTKLYFFVGNYSEAAIVSFPGTTYVNKWSHIAGTFNGTTTRIWLNGVEGSFNDTGTLSYSGSYTFYIGSDGSGRGFDGYIDEILFFNHTISEEQIMVIYQNETNKIVSQETRGGEMWHAAVYVTNGSITNSTYYNTTQLEILENFTALFTSRELLGRPTNNSITINIINGENNVSAYVEYRNSSTAIGNYPFNTTISTNVENKSLIEFTLSNLTPDTAYYYRVRAKRSDGNRYQSPEEKTFRTKRNAAPFNFTLMSDSHISIGSSTALRVTLGNITKDDNSDFVIALGDNIAATDYGLYNHTFDNESNAVKTYEDFRRNFYPENFAIPLFYTVGNWEGEHGWAYADMIANSRNARQKYIPNPDNTTYTEGGGPNEDYFAFTWGNSLFVVLHALGYKSQLPSGPTTHTLGSTQLNWLNQTLTSSNQSWKFIFVHHVLGGNGSQATYGRGGGLAAYVGEQNTIHEIMKNNGIKAIFIGHDHLYTDISVDNIHYTVVPSATTAVLACTTYTDAGYTCYSQTGRVKVEIASDEIANVKFVNNSLTPLSNYTIDRLAPRISLNVSSQAGTVDTDGYILFNYNATDFSILNCSLYLNNGRNQTNSSVSKDTVQNFSLNLSAGSHSWAVKCFDTANNLGSSENRTITVVKATATGVSITNLSQVGDISNVSSFFVKNPDGIINFTASVNLSSGADINVYVNISFNRIELNATALPSLNKTARLTLSNLTFNDPQVLKDNDVCTDCTEVSYSGGTFVFDVTSFSVYTTRETPPSTTTSGGGGGTNYLVPTTHSFSVYPETIETILKQGQQKELILKITNEGDVKLEFTIDTEGAIKNIITISETDFQLIPKGEKIITLSIKPKEKIDYSGKIVIKANSLQKEIPLTITTKEEGKPAEKEEKAPTETIKEEEAKKPAKKIYVPPILIILILFATAFVIFSLTKTGKYKLLMLTRKAGITKISKEKELELKREQQKPSPIIKEAKQLTEQTAKTLQKATREVEKTAAETKKVLAKLKTEEKPPKDQQTRNMIEKLLKEANQQLQKNKQKEAEALYGKIRQHYKNLSWKGKKEYSAKILQLYKKILETRKK